MRILEVKREEYNMGLLKKACDWCDSNYHKKPSKFSKNDIEKKLAIFLENMRNSKAGLNHRKWEKHYEEYVLKRNYNWFSLRIDK